jgi:uncharacterized lipoprotein YddW (UPF0748 family)
MRIVIKAQIRLEAFYFNDKGQSWKRWSNAGTIELYYPTNYHPKSYGVVADRKSIPH